MESSRTRDCFAKARASRLSRIFGDKAYIHATRERVSITDSGNRVMDAVSLSEIRYVEIARGILGRE